MDFDFYSRIIHWLDLKVLFEISHCKLFPLRFFFWQHDSGQVCPQEYPLLVYWIKKRGDNRPSHTYHKTDSRMWSNMDLNLRLKTSTITFLSPLNLYWNRYEIKSTLSSPFTWWVANSGAAESLAPMHAAEQISPNSLPTKGRSVDSPGCKEWWQRHLERRGRRSVVETLGNLDFVGHFLWKRGVELEKWKEQLVKRKQTQLRPKKSPENSIILYVGFLKWWYPQNTPKWSFLVGKPVVG